jgi:hypothetical protein
MLSASLVGSLWTLEAGIASMHGFVEAELAILVVGGFALLFIFRCQIMILFF